MKASESQRSKSGASCPLCLSDPLSSVSGTSEEHLFPLLAMSKEASLSDFDLLNNMDTDSDLEHEGINEGVVL